MIKLRQTFILLCLLFCATIQYAQAQTVTGTVTDNNGTPLAGVTVAVKGKKALVTATGATGKFNVAANPSTDVLVFTYVGFQKREIGINKTIFRPGVNYEGIPYPVDSKGFAGIYTGFSFKKYTVYDNAPTPVVTENKSYINGILLRYADVLLMYAEAQNEASGPDASVYDAIRQVRQRAGITQPNLPAGLSQSDMRAKIMHERRIEFVGEGLYFSDVRRWGTANVELNRAVQLNGSYKAGIMDIREYDPNKNDLFPIPQHEIDNSQKAITQNPGY